MSDPNNDLDLDQDLDPDEGADPGDTDPSKTGDEPNGAGGGDDTVDENDPEAVKAAWKKEQQKNADLATKNRRLYERVKKSSGRKPNSNPPAKTDDVKEKLEKVAGTVDQLALSEAKRTFGYEHNLSPQEVDAVFRINPKPTKETLDDPFIKGGLDAIRAKNRVTRNTPSGRGRGSATVNGKGWNQMDAKERQENFQSMMGKRLGQEE